MRFKVSKYKNDNLEEVVEIEAPCEDSLVSLLGLEVDSGLKISNKIIKSLKLKGTDIDVYISNDGVFFFFTPDGDEAVLDDTSINWIDEPVGFYHEHILKILDIDFYLIEKV